MKTRYTLTEYVSKLMDHAVYDKLEDGTYTGRIPKCKGVVAFGATLRECEEELRSTLEDWILVGLKLGHPLPVVGGINLNKEPACEPVDAVKETGLHRSPAEAGIRWHVLGIPAPVHGLQTAPAGSSIHSRVLCSHASHNDWRG